MKRIDPQRHAPRFWTKVKVLDEHSCWEWTGALDSNGYGAFYPGHAAPMERAHRVAFFLWHGTDPGELCVCHHCDNPPCCNPQHHFLGTRDDNNKDRHRKGRDRIPMGESHGRAKLSWVDVQTIRSSPLSRRVLAQRYGVSASTIGRVLNDKGWHYPDSNTHARAIQSGYYEQES